MTKTKYLDLVALWLMLLVFIPIIGNNLPSLAHSVKFASALWILGFFIFDTKTAKSKYFLIVVSTLVFIYLIGYHLIWAYVKADAIVRSKSEIEHIVIATSLSTYFLKDYTSRMKLGKITKWSLWGTIVTCFMTIIVTIINPSIVRNSYSGGEGIETFNKYGAGGYGLAAVLLMLIPSIVYLTKYHKISKTKGIFIICLFIFTLFRMQIFANILLSILILTLALLGSSHFRKTFVIFVFLSLLIITIPLDNYSNALIKIADNFEPSSLIYFKLNDLSTFIYSGGASDVSSAGMKAGRYSLLYQPFSDNPLLGGFFSPNTNYWWPGFHLYWMYKLGSFGIFGLSLYGMIHYLYIKNSMKYLNNDYKFYFLLSCFSLIALGLMKNLGGREMWITYFVLLHGINYIPKNVFRSTNVQE